ncbi:hypothetical protein CEXT_333971 [Caerostris extrusa]|uniref:Uncharacterized protein n=1 Tax=Caerostris extrusa TaxID=172846 RepID=A0AAV4XWB5_CAEEX|nr:hypothetical protein CEXT_333971 [Caerostris extrusa]
MSGSPRGRLARLQHGAGGWLARLLTTAGAVPGADGPDLGGACRRQASLMFPHSPVSSFSCLSWVLSLSWLPRISAAMPSQACDSAVDEPCIATE